MVNKVFAVRCNSYEQTEEKLFQLLELMGGISEFVKKDERIVLKPNLLRAADPEKAVTTHPSIVAAVGRAVRSAGGVPFLVESPGTGYSHSRKTLENLYKRCKMDNAADAAGVELNFDISHRIVSNPGGTLIRRIEMMTPIIEADGLINLCKLKTHSFMVMTGAVKNLFGVIPGRMKAGYHAKLNSPDRFASMLLDLIDVVAPRLSVMDAVVCMEGNGPSGGIPRPVGYLLASTNPLALDVIVGETMAIPLEKNPILKAADAKGIVPVRPDDIEIIGASIDELHIPDYKLPQSIFQGSGFEYGPSWLQHVINRIFVNGVTLEPKIRQDRCTACGACRIACPVGTIQFIDDSYAQIDPKNCIRCYCCHEMCPEDAIDLKGNFLYRMIQRLRLG